MKARILAKTQSTQREKQVNDGNEIDKWIVDVAVQLHREMGPGLLERVYKSILAHALRLWGLPVDGSLPSHRVAGSQVRGFRADILVENKMIVELKCVEKLNNTYRKQLLLAAPHWDKAGLFTEF